MTVDLAARRASRGGEELTLRPKEFELLALLVANAGKAVTRERIMREVWDTDWMGSTKTLDTHILGLRHKLGPDAITTLRGVGYRLEDGVRRRLVVAIAGVATAAVVLLAVPLGLVLAAQLPRPGAAAAAARHDRRDARRSTSAGRGDPIELPRSSDALAVYDRDGRRRRGPRARPSPTRSCARRCAGPARPTRRRGGSCVVAVPLLSGERVAGAVRAERADAARRADTRGRG